MFDVAILGGGPGGYVAAIRASKLGANVCLIEEREVGGTCLNRGCIPTKAFLSSADLYRNILKAGEFGISVESLKFDFGKIVERKDRVVTNLRNGVLKLLKDGKIKLIKGKGKLLDSNTIEIKGENEERISAKNIILATGSEPLIPQIFNISSPLIITSDDALNLSELPQSIIIAGGGYLGCEWAIIFKTFGCNVTVVEMMKTIVPTEDIHISRFLQTYMQKQGIKFITGTKILEVKEENNQIEAVLDGEKSIKSDKMLLSIGRKLNTRNLGFEETGIKFDGEKIVIDEYMKTNIPNIFAIGDITGKKLLAHVASAQGIVAAENAMNHKSKMIDYELIPGCIYTNPEAASIGLTEQALTEKGIKFLKSRFPLAANGKANCIGEPDGFVKVLADEETHRVLGVHIIGPKATELISECACIISKGMTAKEVADIIHPHPTVSESIMEACAGIEKEAIHFNS